MLNNIKTIGIIGGGQLARMMSMAAARLGFRTIVLEPDTQCPAAQTAKRHIIAPYDDLHALEYLTKNCDVITYEFENVPATALAALHNKVKLFPNPRALKKSQDRLFEKQFLNEHGIDTAPFYPVDNMQSLKAGLNKLRNHGILKTRRFGYDGKGQVVFGKNAGNEINDNDLQQAFRDIGNTPAILEGFVDFKMEISVIAARNKKGEMAFYDCPQNIHKEGILYLSIVPAKIDKKISDAAKLATKKLLEALDYVGVLTLEFFVLNNGTVIANEFAPRVHNSGHWTETACAVSQFEQHIRAICNLPLGDTTRHSDCIMGNIIGEDIENMPALLKEPQTYIHIYGKQEVRKGRKMGHFTRIIS